MHRSWVQVRPSPWVRHPRIVRSPGLKSTDMADPPVLLSPFGECISAAKLLLAWLVVDSVFVFSDCCGLSNPRYGGTGRSIPFQGGQGTMNRVCPRCLPSPTGTPQCCHFNLQEHQRNLALPSFKGLLGTASWSSLSASSTSWLGVLHFGFCFLARHYKEIRTKRSASLPDTSHQVWGGFPPEKENKGYVGRFWRFFNSYTCW